MVCHRRAHPLLYDANKVNFMLSWGFAGLHLTQVTGDGLSVSSTKVKAKLLVKLDIILTTPSSQPLAKNEAYGSNRQDSILFDLFKKMILLQLLFGLVQICTDYLQ